MATYSLNGLGGVPFTGYTNTLGSGQANQDATSGVVAFNGITQGDERIAKMLRNGGMSIVLKKLLIHYFRQPRASLLHRPRSKSNGSRAVPVA
jgi:hypothetical protein